MTIEALKVIGNKSNHDQHAMHIITGRADFAGDRSPKNKLYGALLLSNITHGVITNVDVRGALRVAGVQAVITHSDCPIWSETIRYWGQEVAGVIARDPWVATAATERIIVSYNRYAYSFDPDQAMEKGAPPSNYPCNLLPPVSNGF